MGRPKKDMTMVRFAIPTEAYKRFERLAKVLSMDVNTTFRVCASLQLAQYEVTVLGPDVRETQVEREARATEVAHELLPELRAKPEPEPEPAKPFGFGGSRSELEPVEVEPVEPVRVAPLIKREYIGYMRGL